MANWSDVGENGLLGIGKMVADSKDVFKGLKRGMMDPTDLTYYFPQARVLRSSQIRELRGMLATGAAVILTTPAYFISASPYETHTAVRCAIDFTAHG